jgi:quercetin dioxygenase-like cupin family protein
MLTGVTFDLGYALGPGDAVEHLDMGEGSRLSLKVTGRESRGLVTVLEGVVHSGGPPLHVHDAEDEVVIVLEGELDYQLGDERGVLAAGGLLWMPREVSHAVANLSDDPCRFLTVVSRVGSRTSFAGSVTTSPGWRRAHHRTQRDSQRCRVPTRDESSGRRSTADVWRSSPW